MPEQYYNEYSAVMVENKALSTLTYFNYGRVLNLGTDCFENSNDGLFGRRKLGNHALDCCCTPTHYEFHLLQLCLLVHWWYRGMSQMFAPCNLPPHVCYQQSYDRMLCYDWAAPYSVAELIITSLQTSCHLFRSGCGQQD